jgi:4'-phosphopantetheinyl transferase
MPDMFALHVDESENISLSHDGERPEYSFREIDLHDGYRYAYCIKNECKNAPQEVSVVALSRTSS